MVFISFFVSLTILNIFILKSLFRRLLFIVSRVFTLFVECSLCVAFGFPCNFCHFCESPFGVDYFLWGSACALDYEDVPGNIFLCLPLLGPPELKFYLVFENEGSELHVIWFPV